MPGVNSLESAMLQYSQFISAAHADGVKDRTVIGSDRQPGEGDAVISIGAKSKTDFIGHIGRSAASRDENNEIRDRFLESVKTMFGVSDETKLPESVRTAMKLEDYDHKGKPLTARRIRAVQTAVDEHFAAQVKELEDLLTFGGVPKNDTLKQRIQVAVMACRGKQDAFDLIMRNPLKIFFEKQVPDPEMDDDDDDYDDWDDEDPAPSIFMEDGDTKYRLLGEDEVTRQVEELTHAADSLREATGDDKQLFDAAKPFLVAENDTVIDSQPFLTSAVDAVNKLDPAELAKLGRLTPTASARDIQEAAIAFNNLLSTAMGATGIQQETDLATKVTRSRLLASMIFAKGTANSAVSLRQVRTALEAGPASRMLKKYCLQAADFYNKKAHTKGIPGANRLARQAKRWSEQATMLDEMKAAIDLICGANEVVNVPLVPIEPLDRTVTDEEIGFTLRDPASI